MKEPLSMLLNLSDERFDPIAKIHLKALLNSNATDDEMRTGLHELLDKCVNGSLCSNFEIGVLDLAWKHYGGKPDDPAPWRAQYDRTFKPPGPGEGVS